ncbi:unnamed protein product, partial [Prorocentrum cordatum]
MRPTAGCLHRASSEVVTRPPPSASGPPNPFLGSASHITSGGSRPLAGARAPVPGPAAGSAAGLQAGAAPPPSVASGGVQAPVPQLPRAAASFAPSSDGAMRMVSAAISSARPPPSAGPLAAAAAPDAAVAAASAMLARSASHAAIGMSGLQFKFEPVRRGGPQLPGDAWPGGAIAAGYPPGAWSAPPPSPPLAVHGPPAAADQPRARGREGVLGRIGAPALGVSQEPTGCTLQLDECVAQCRRDVQEIAASCRVRGRKYRDPEFPPDERALYANG